ncbi:hypothetical protein [Mucilaginibacter lacusdianchii]|uniref:hypothetical protein n=1 Tax=Mucilaginibacter lacusdianchii TaxID=2684211 RepID=UPI00131C3A5A|nr:hypothetical protein [Mucilaginibacter sp. JXJ CY 39]
MNHKPLNICSLLLFLCMCLWLSSCKKDALQVEEEKEYLQTNASPIVDPMFSTATHLLLKPGNIAYINPGGDIMWDATYKISGKKLTVKMKDSDSQFKFTIVSEEELHGQDGEVLKLVKR